MTARGGGEGVAPGVLFEQRLDAGTEELLFAQPVEGFVVLLNQRVDSPQGFTNGVLAKVVIERLELQQRHPAERAGRLVDVLVFAGRPLGAQGGDEHVLVEFTRDDILEMIGQGPSRRSWIGPLSSQPGR